MAGQMKGLTQFMADIRNAKAQEEEDKRVQVELVNIQKQFADSQHLSGYQRKKYVCKLLYIYLLGSDKINFGFMESIELITSNVYSEKQIGYLAVELFVSRDRELLLTVVNSLKTDLASDNIDFIALALQCIATLGEETLAEALTEDVFMILRSPTHEPFLKKKASLALLKLLQVSPYLILEKHTSWIPRILACIDDEDLGFAQSITSTVIFIARYAPDLCRSCILSVTSRLTSLIINEDCPNDYFYHDVPAPWFTIKLLNLVEILIPDTYSSQIDNITLSNLRNVVARAISKSVDRNNANKTQQFKNAQSSILFSAISLGAHLDPSSDASNDAIDALGSLIHAHETNTRYLSLDALVKVTSRGGPTAIRSTFKYLLQILASLKDRDISIRRKLLDLLYTICDSHSVEKICSELLAHLEQSDYSMKTEIAIKVAVLAEKFSTDATWYITTSLKLISLAGNHIADEVWERTIQIIVNNEKIQPLAVRTVIRQLKMNNFPESIVKVATFIIGEFGYMVGNFIPTSEQFELLIDKYYYCSSLTKSMMLSAFLKIYIRDDSMRAQILDVLESETYSIESEVQQRAAEYLRLVTREDNLVLARDVCQQLPPFLDNDSPLISRLGNVKDAKEFTKISGLSRKGTFKLPAPPLPRRTRTLTNSSMSTTPMTPQRTSESALKSPMLKAQSSGDMMATSANGSSSVLMSSRNVSSQDTTMLGYDSDVNKNAIGQHLSPGWEEGYFRMLHFDQGIFYESSLLKIICRCRRGRNNLHFQLTYVNKSPLPITGFSLSISMITGPEAPFVISTSELPSTNIPLGGRATHGFECITRSIFDESALPVLQLSFLSGTLTQLFLKLPIVLMKSISLAPMNSAEEFFRRWQQISLLGSDGEAQKIFSVGHRHSNESIVRIIERIGFSIVEDVDNNSTNIVGAGILHTLQVNAGCLLRLEPNDEGKQFRLTMRCTSPGVSKTLSQTIIELFEHGF